MAGIPFDSPRLHQTAIGQNNDNSDTEPQQTLAISTGCEGFACPDDAPEPTTSKHSKNTSERLQNAHSMHFSKLIEEQKLLLSHWPDLPEHIRQAILLLLKPYISDGDVETHFSDERIL